MVPLNRDDIEMSSASADEQRSCDWTALGNRATPSYPDSQTLSTKPASMEGGVRIKHEVPFLCRNRRPPDKIPGLTQMRLHRQQIDALDAAIAEIDQESHGTEYHWSREVANLAGSLSPAISASMMTRSATRTRYHPENSPRYLGPASVFNCWPIWR